MIDEESLRRLRDLTPVKAPPIHGVATRARSIRRRQRVWRTSGGAATVLALIVGLAVSQIARPTSRPAEVAVGSAGFGVPAPLGDPVCLGSSRRAQDADADGLRYLFPPPTGFRLASAFAKTDTWKPDCFQWVNRLVLTRGVDPGVVESVLTVGEGTVHNVQVGCDETGPQFTECVMVGDTRVRLFAPSGGDWIGVFWTRPDGVAVRVTAHDVTREEVLRFAKTVEVSASLAALSIVGPPGFAKSWELPGKLPVPPLTSTRWTANYVATETGRQPQQLNVEVARRELPQLATTIVGPYENVVVRGHPAVLGTDGNGVARSISWDEQPGLSVRISAAGVADRQMLLNAAERLQLVSADEARVNEPK